MSGMDAAEGRMIGTILAHADSRPGDGALACGDTVHTWRGLRDAVLAAAGAIDAACPRGAGRIALLGGASGGLVVAYLATVAAGGCAVPLPVSAHPDALASMLDDCEPDLIFAQEVHAALPPPRWRERLVTLAGDLPRSFLDGAPPLTGPREVRPDEPFNIIYSSGTTGRPKGIVHSHAMRYRQAARSLFGLDPSSTMLLSTPLYSNTTLMPMLATLFHGGRVVLMPKFDAEAYLALAERKRVTHTMLVPVQYQRILAAESFPRRDLSSFRVKQSTGAPLRAADKAEIVARWPGRMVEIYGLTEGGCTSILDVGAYPDKAHTVGRPAAGNDIRVIDGDGNTLPAGERGEIVGRSHTMMSGYFRNEAANEAFYWQDRDGNVFHRTGDIGMFDEDGFLVLVGRKKDMIISGGFNIYASDLEEKLHEHPGVAEVAVIAVPSERWGETPLGLVVPKADAVVVPEELLAWVNARLGRNQRLSAIEYRESLPRSNVGKVLKQELSEPYWKDGA